MRNHSCRRVYSNARFLSIFVCVQIALVVLFRTFAISPLRYPTYEFGETHPSEWRNIASPALSPSSLQAQPSLWLAQAPPETWLCTLPSSQMATAKPRVPIHFLADRRTGSTFFFGLLLNFNVLTDDRAFDLLVLYEAFNDRKPKEKILGIRLFADVMKACHLTYKQSNSRNSITRFLASNRTLRDIDDVAHFLQNEMVPNEWDILQPVLHAVKNRFDDPLRLIKTITRIPQHSEQAYFIFKIFPYQFDLIRMTPSKFIHEINQLCPTDGVKHHVMVLYRRRIIDMIVSLKIALARDQWMNVHVTQKDVINLTKEEIEFLVNAEMSFLKGLRQFFDANHIDYHLFEYSRDLKDPQAQMATVRRLRDILKIPFQTHN